jgi:ABC-type multidrug transport system fused ATPase/permease subunit
MNLKNQYDAKTKKIKSFILLFSTAKWILGKRQSTIMIFASTGQIIVALLDILFLALVGPLVISFSAQEVSENGLSILGKFTISNDNLLISLVLIVLVKSVAGLLIHRLILSSFAIREAEVGTALVQASLFDRSNQNSHSVELLQTFTSTISLVFGNLFKPMIGFIGELATLCAVIVGLLVINTEVAVAAICYFSLFGYFIIWSLGRMQQILGENSLKTGRELLRSFTEIRLMSRELRFAHKDQDALLALNHSRIKHTHFMSTSVFLHVIPRYIFEIVFLFGVGLLVLFLEYFQKNLSVLPILALLVAAGYRILPSLNYITIAMGNFRSSIAPLSQINSLGDQFDIRSTDLNFKKIKSNSENKRFSGALHLENITYQYTGSQKTIFSDFNLVVNSGKTLLIQGLSGAGKTTLIALATGLLKPQQGRVYTFAQDDVIVMDQFVKGISYLSQDVPLLDETFAYNIALEETFEKDFNRLKNVADEAGILDRILQSPKGFNTQIGENGTLLSAGERQRLGIARSLYSGPALLILDEPTANLDAESENLIWNTLFKIKGQLTILIVSHRLVPEQVYDDILKLPVSS